MYPTIETQFLSHYSKTTKNSSMALRLRHNSLQGTNFACLLLCLNSSQEVDVTGFKAAIGQVEDALPALSKHNLEAAHFIAPGKLSSETWDGIQSVLLDFKKNSGFPVYINCLPESNISAIDDMETDMPITNVTKTSLFLSDLFANKTFIVNQNLKDKGIIESFILA